jgi:predicted nucleic acid-binding protein
MGLKYLLDTNVVIYLLDGKLPDACLAFMRKEIQLPIVSVITVVKARGFLMPEATEQLFKSFFNSAQVLDFDKPVIERTIQLRKTYKIKTPDAMIAATAIEYDLVLFTRNTADFSKITGIQVLDPFSI